jgi:HPt (histidine-containing phosphotransfer) domain-containing protein
MLTVEGLKALGANTDEGISRCMGNEDFYLKMVTMSLGDANFDRLRTSLEAGDLDEAFESAHALKGVLSNVSLTSLAAPVIEITEDLRARTDKDYSEQMNAIFGELDRYRDLL